MRSTVLRLAMLSAGFGLAGPALGAEGGASMASLEDVVVTATKREEKLKDVAMSIAEYGNSGAVNQRGQAVFIQPRTLGVQVAVKF